MTILNLFKLEENVSVVTGAGKGIGKGIAIALAQAGSNIVLASRTKSDLIDVQKEIKKIGKEAIVFPIDVTNPESIEALSEKTIKEFGKISTWVNNAGGLPDGTPRYLTKTSVEEFEAQISLNFSSVFSGCVTAARKMTEGGSIINISSRSSKNMAGNLKNGPYAASKAAVNSLTATLALELAPKIRVNAIAPGPIPTENFKDSMNMHSEEREKELKKYIPIPLKRWGNPEDIGAAVVFMASKASSWVTGQCLFIDGGT